MLALVGTQLNIFYKSLEFVFSFPLSASLFLSPTPSPLSLWYPILTTPAALVSQLSLYNSGHLVVLSWGLLSCIKA